MLWMGFALGALQRWAEAVATFRRAVELTHGSPTMLGALGWALGGAGETTEAHAVATGLVERARAGHVPLVASLLSLLGTGQIEPALDCLDEALAQRSSFLVGLGVYAFLDPLREHPRFRRALVITGVSTHTPRPA